MIVKVLVLPVFCLVCLDWTDLIAADRLVQLRLEAQHLGAQPVSAVHQLGLIRKYQVVCVEPSRAPGRIGIIDLAWPPCQLCSSH